MNAIVKIDTTALTCSISQWFAVLWFHYWSTLNSEWGETMVTNKEWYEKLYSYRLDTDQVVF